MPFLLQCFLSVELHAFFQVCIQATVITRRASMNDAASQPHKPGCGESLHVLVAWIIAFVSCLLVFSLLWCFCWLANLDIYCTNSIVVSFSIFQIRWYAFVHRAYLDIVSVPILRIFKLYLLYCFTSSNCVDLSQAADWFGCVHFEFVKPIVNVT